MICVDGSLTAPAKRAANLATLATPVLKCMSRLVEQWSRLLACKNANCAASSGADTKCPIPCKWWLLYIFSGLLGVQLTLRSMARYSLFVLKVLLNNNKDVDVAE